MSTTHTTQHKLADSRYVPGLSGNDDDMTDAEWFDAMGEPSAPLLTHRDIGIVCYPEQGGFYEETFTVDPSVVSESSDGLLTAYLMHHETIQHEWAYRLPTSPHDAGDTAYHGVK